MSLGKLSGSARASGQAPWAECGWQSRALTTARHREQPQAEGTAWAKAWGRRSGSLNLALNLLPILGRVILKGRKSQAGRTSDPEDPV